MSKDYRNKALLYHLTPLANLKSILTNGVQSRASLDKDKFTDIADPEILESRQSQGLEQYVPFHFFSKTPFDYAVQRSSPQESFVLLTVRRTYAKSNDWKIIPSHPLGRKEPEVMDYSDGFNAIDWDLMESEEDGVSYATNNAYKQTCMAECLSPTTIPASTFVSIFVKTLEDKQTVETLLASSGISPHVNHQPTMFPRNTA